MVINWFRIDHTSRTHIHTHTLTHTLAHAHTRTDARAHTHTHTDPKHTHTHTQNTHTRTHTHSHTRTEKHMRAGSRCNTGQSNDTVMVTSKTKLKGNKKKKNPLSKKTSSKLLQPSFVPQRASSIRGQREVFSPPRANSLPCVECFACPRSIGRYSRLPSHPTDYYTVVVRFGSSTLRHATLTTRNVSYVHILRLLNWFVDFLVRLLVICSLTSWLGCWLFVR